MAITWSANKHKLPTRETSSSLLSAARKRHSSVSTAKERVKSAYSLRTQKWLRSWWPQTTSRFKAVSSECLENTESQVSSLPPRLKPFCYLAAVARFVADLLFSCCNSYIPAAKTFPPGQIQATIGISSYYLGLFVKSDSARVF